MIYHKAVFGEPFRAPELEPTDPPNAITYLAAIGQAYTEWVNIQYEGLGH